MLRTVLLVTLGIGCNAAATLSATSQPEVSREEFESQKAELAEIKAKLAAVTSRLLEFMDSRDSPTDPIDFPNMTAVADKSELPDMSNGTMLVSSTEKLERPTWARVCNSAGGTNAKWYTMRTRKHLGWAPVVCDPALYALNPSCYQWIDVKAHEMTYGGKKYYDFCL